MSLNNGLGGFVATETKMIQGSLGTQLACALHANGKDTWLIGRRVGMDTLVAWLVADTGMSKVVYSKLGSNSRVPNIKSNFPLAIGYDSQIKTSPNSEMLLIPRRTLEFPVHELYRFNRETGEVYGRVGIKDTTKSPPFFLNGYPDGAFSADSKVLYIGTGTRSKISFENEGPGTFWQYSVENYDSLAIAQSKMYLGILGRGIPTKPEPTPFVPRFQLAIDGRIYVSPGTTADSLMSVIHCPNNRGNACQLKLREISLGKGRNGSFFPTLNQTFIRNAGIFQLQANKRSLCQGDTLELSAYGAGAEHFTWSVIPLPQGLKLDILTWQRFSTKEMPVGAYTFKCQSTSRCGDVYEKSMVVNVRPNPAKPVLSGSPPLLINKATLCLADSLRLLVPDTSSKYHWSFGDDSASLLFINTGLTYTQKVSLVTENQYGCQSLPSDTMIIENKPIPQAPKPVIQSVPAVYVDSGFVALCPGDSVTLSATGSAAFVWSDGSNLPNRTFTGSGSFSLIGYNTEGCAAKAETEVRYKTVVNPKPVFIQGDTILNLNTLSGQSYCVPLIAKHRYSWTATNGTITDTIADCATVQWNPGTANRSLNVVQTSPVGCVGSSRLNIAYRPNLNIPSLITPNGDSHNDSFIIQDLEFYASHSLQIFDRWGKKVVDTTAYKQDWKGDSGIYFYNLVVEGNEFKGWVSVMK